MAVLLLCKCGSDRVDLRMWNGDRAQLACLTCGQVSWLDGFTVSEFDIGKLLNAALVDQARKHRRRNPAEAAQLQARKKA
jgi:hypothetical protein